MRRPSLRPLTDRQERFVELYVSGHPPVRFNASRSAEAAGYRWPGKQGPRLMAFPAVAWHVEVRFRIRYLIARREG
jgi:phage terminase small subunit